MKQSLTLSKKKFQDNCLITNSYIRNIERPITAKSRLPAQYYKIPRDTPYTKFFQQNLFCDNLQLALIEKFSVQVQIMDVRNDVKYEGAAYMVTLSGSQVQVLPAYDALELLLTMSLEEKTFGKDIGNIKLR